MGESDVVDPNMVAAGTVLLVVSATILFLTGRLTSPVPILALGTVPAFVGAVLWFRTGGRELA